MKTLVIIAIFCCMISCDEKPATPGAVYQIDYHFRQQWFTLTVKENIDSIYFIDQRNEPFSFHSSQSRIDDIKNIVMENSSLQALKADRTKVFHGSTISYSVITPNHKKTASYTNVGGFFSASGNLPEILSEIQVLAEEK